MGCYSIANAAYTDNSYTYSNVFVSDPFYYHQRYSNQSSYLFDQMSKIENKNEPPYSGKDLGNDPAKCPGEGFEWKGKDEPGGKKGSWYNEGTKESLHPDLDHPSPKKPHWDYRGSSGEMRINIDGTWEWK